MNSKFKIAASAFAGVAMLAAAFTAFAATPALFGNATADNTGVTLVSNASSSPAYGGIDFGAPAASTTLSQLGSLMANYQLTAGDCGGGSPRFQINVASSTDPSSTANIFAYFGPSPSYTGCGTSATTTGELGQAGSMTVDTSQLPGGTFYDTWTHALSAYGDYPVIGLQIVADGGWSQTGGNQTVLLNSATVNGMPFDLTTLGTASTTSSTTLMAPTGLTPNGVTLTGAQWTSANWNAVSASSTPVMYMYESSNSGATNPDGSFASPVYQSGWSSTNSISTAGTADGTYYWHVMAMDNSGNLSPWSDTASVVVNSATSTGTTTPCAASDAITALTNLQAQFPAYSSQIQSVIDALNATCSNSSGGGTGTPPPTSGNGTIDQNGMTVNAGSTIDFVGRNFDHEENITVTLNGSTVANAHADGGGNFSTGNLTAPSTPGMYTYTFMGADGDSSNATITVQ